VFLTSALERILQCDYPKNWPSFLPEVIAKLDAEDPATLYGALVSLHILLKSFRLYIVDRIQAAVLLTSVFQSFGQ
jgi:hypothetical protein